MNISVKKGILAGIGFSITTIFFIGTFAVWNGLIAESGDTLDVSKWNELVNNVSGINTDENGNVGIGTIIPGSKLDVEGSFIRKINYSTANGPKDETDNGQITTRVLNFTKEKEDTVLRISYTDALRTYGVSGTCRWEIKVDGVSCLNQPLIYDFYALTGSNIHRSNNLVGYCQGITSGSHQIQVWVSTAANDCYTGYNQSTWVIEAQEVN